MTDVEYVARVVIERVERRVVPNTATSRRTTGEDRTIRDKAEVASFVIRADNLGGLRDRVSGMLDAALPDANVIGETTDHDEEDEEEEPFI